MGAMQRTHAGKAKAGKMMAEGKRGAFVEYASGKVSFELIMYAQPGLKRRKKQREIDSLL